VRKLMLLAFAEHQYIEAVEINQKNAELSGQLQNQAVNDLRSQMLAAVSSTKIRSLVQIL
jgi:hypothetical protein